jgi:carbon storage regulator
MLVLTRKENELIKFGDNIKITVVRIDRGHVSMGVEAPEGGKVIRGETQEQRSTKRNNYLMLLKREGGDE